MNEKDPLLEKINKMQLEIKEEGKLKKKINPVNKLVIGTSLILLSGTLTGLVRILMNVFG